MVTWYFRLEPGPKCHCRPEPNERCLLDDTLKCMLLNKKQYWFDSNFMESLPEPMTYHQ